MTKTRTSVVKSAETPSDATSSAAATEPRVDEKPAAKSSGDDVVDLRARVEALEADIAFLRQALGWPTK